MFADSLEVLGKHLFPFFEVKTNINPNRKKPLRGKKNIFPSDKYAAGSLAELKSLSFQLQFTRGQ